MTLAKLSLFACAFAMIAGCQTAPTSSDRTAPAPAPAPAAAEAVPAPAPARKEAAAKEEPSKKAAEGDIVGTPAPGSRFNKVRLGMGMKDPIVGVVGALQFEVLQFRVEHEYGARIILDRLPFSHARWVVGAHFDSKSFDWEGNRQTVQDRDGLPLVLFRDDWALQHAEEKHPELKFLSAAPQLRQLAATGS